MSLRVKLLIGAVAFVVVYAGISIAGARIAMEIPRVPLDTSPGTYSLVYRDVSFPSREENPVTLKGWLLPGTNGRVVVILNGGFRNRADIGTGTLPLARDLVERGYSVLLFDFRGRGESEGEGRSLSFIPEDIGGAMDFLSGQGFGPERVALLGFSSGAVAAAIFGAGEKLGAVILDGPFNAIFDSMRDHASLNGVPGPVFTFFFPGVAAAAHLFYDFRPVDTIDVIGDIAAPVLIIHEEKDNLQSPADAQALLAAAGKPVDELWIVPSAGHSLGYVTAPQAYVDTVTGFLDRHLG